MGFAQLLQNFVFLECDATVSISTVDEHELNIDTKLPPCYEDGMQLTAAFTVTNDATVSIGTTLQVSGITENNFREPVVYTCTSSSPSIVEETWVVYVDTTHCDQTSILYYKVEGQTDLRFINNTIKFAINKANDISQLIATFNLSPRAQVEIDGIEQHSGITENDFNKVLHYNITAENNINQQEWTVNALDNRNDITGLSITDIQISPEIDTEDHTVEVEVPYGRDINSLEAQISISKNASGATTIDCMDAVIYTVTSEYGEEQDWTIYFHNALNTENDIVRFQLNYMYDGTIDKNNHTVSVEVPYGTNRKVMSITSFNVSPDASFSNEVSSIKDFTNTVDIDVTAHNGSSQTWSIIVTELPPQANILWYEVDGQTNFRIDPIDQNIDIAINKSEYNLAQLTATFDLSYGATASIGTTIQESGVTSVDLGTPVEYTITAADGTCKKWTVRALDNRNLIDSISFPYPKILEKPIIIDLTNHSASIEINYDIPLTSLDTVLLYVPDFATSSASEINPSESVDITITSEFGESVTWTIYFFNALNTENDITKFCINDTICANEDEIDENHHCIKMSVAYEVGNTNLSIDMDVSPDAFFPPGMLDTTNFSDTVKIDVTAQNRDVQTWDIIINREPNTKADILSFNFLTDNCDGYSDNIIGDIDNEDKQVNIEIPFEVKECELTADFIISENATIDPDELIVNSEDDFSDQKLSITSQSDIKNIWYISIKREELDYRDLMIEEFVYEDDSLIYSLNYSGQTLEQSTKCAIYVSQDTLWDKEQDFELYNETLFSSTSFPVTIREKMVFPDDLSQLATYYLILVADAGNTIPECVCKNRENKVCHEDSLLYNGGEENNIVIIPFTIPPRYLYFEQAEYEFDYSEQQCTLQVETNLTGWQVATSDNWISDVAVTGDIIFISLDENEGYEAREAIITLNKGDKKYESTTIKQNAKSRITATPDIIELDYRQGSSANISVSSNLDCWQASSFAEWLYVTPYALGGSHTISVQTVNYNMTGEERTAYIFVAECGTVNEPLRDTIIVYQNFINGIRNQTNGKINVYPVPVSHTLTIESAKQSFDYWLETPEGKLIRKGKGLRGKNNLSVSSIPPGLYILRLITEDQTCSFRKILITR